MHLGISLTPKTGWNFVTCMDGTTGTAQTNQVHKDRDHITTLACVQESKRENLVKLNGRKALTNS